MSSHYRYIMTFPKTLTYSAEITEDYALHFFSVHYTNVVQISMYDGDTPRMGSLVVGLPDSLHSDVLFAGKHSNIALALAQILSTKLQSGVYASVYLSDKLPVDIEILHKILPQYIEYITNQLVLIKRERSTNPI